MPHPQRVLVVDDDAVIRRIVGSTLVRAGFLMTYATDGETAWHELQHLPIDLVITDRSMPRVDGMELMRRIRGSAEHAALPVIMLSGSMEDAVRGEAISQGANACLGKSLSSSELLEAVARVLSASSYQPAVTRDPPTVR